EKASRNAQIEVLEIYTWAQLVETFGDIPYSQALNDSEYVLPQYDDAATIYSDLLTRLTAVIPTISGTGFGSSDPIYGGDATAWTKFANSLLLRMGLRVVDVSSMTTQASAAITTAVSGGVFTSNADNAEVEYQSATPNTNPVWVDLVQS
ncbi:SusD/RagB family nutrient-binding outer membrane lipoprotein, partial [Cellulophaga baltica]